MSYATVATFNALFSEAELIGLTDRVTNAAVNTVIAQQAFDDADAEIHSYIAALFDVPLNPAPRQIVRVACDIARYRLWDDAPGDEVAARYKAALAWLKDVAAGRALIVGDDGQPIALSTAEKPSPGAAAGSRKLELNDAFERAYTFPQHSFTVCL